jgi:L-ascorbate 6-phosphate lactonase
MSDVQVIPRLIDDISNDNSPAGSVAVWWLGQASFVLKAAGIVVYIDPYLQESTDRLSPPAFPPDAVTNADIVVLTHDHIDHVDPDALPGIAKASPRARFVAPRPIAQRVADLIGGKDRLITAVADESLSVEVRGSALDLRPVPAKHEEFDLTPDGYPYLGYTLSFGGVTVHHSGDTIPYEGQIDRVKLHDVDLALLPINGRDVYRTRVGTIGNMDYREAGEFAAAIGAKVVIPMHYGMFRGNTVPPGHFISHLAEFHPEQSAHVMGRFGKYVFVK